MLFSEPPVIAGGTEEKMVTAVEGESAALQCLASGYPDPIISWYKVMKTSYILFGAS